MNIKFIGQGYNIEANTSVAAELITAFSNPDYSSFKCLVAFASYSGVSALTRHIELSKKHITEHKVIVGIDHEGTSKEALEELLAWNIDAYVYYTSSNRPIKHIFHPKIYMFKGEKKALIIIGSNNLTEYGLTYNVEGAVSIEHDYCADDRSLVTNQIETYFTNMFNSSDINLKKISEQFIAQLNNTGLLPSDENRRDNYETNLLQHESREEARRNIIDLFTPSLMQEAPANFSPRRRQQTLNISEPNRVEESIVQVDRENWRFVNSSLVLIAEIGGPSRWKQISFSKENFETFFEVPLNVGGEYYIRLRYINLEGLLEEGVENCKAIVKGSSNYNLEPSKVRESSVEYDRHNKPIILFIKLNNRDFVYHFATHGSQIYTELKRSLVNASGIIKRRELDIENLRLACPSLIL